MKTFISTLLGVLGFIFILNFIVDPLGLRETPITRYTQQNTQHCAIDLALIPEAAQVKLKEALLNQRHADTIIVGNSRVMTVRGVDLGSQHFVNFGISYKSKHVYS